MASEFPLRSEVFSADSLKKKTRIGEDIIRGVLMLFSALSVLTTVGIVIILGRESLNFFATTQWQDTNKSVAEEFDASATVIEFTTSGADVFVGDRIRIGQEVMEIVALDGLTATVERGLEDTEIVAHREDADVLRSNNVRLIDTLTGSRWLPQLTEFGIWPLLMSTLMTSFIAMIIALPTGLAAAIYLSEYASPRARNTLKPILEVLAGIPTVVYGYFALTFMTPLLRTLFNRSDEIVSIFNTASAGIVVGILIIPLVSSLSEDALHAVPDSLRMAALGVGATKLETSLRVVLPAALSGITAAFVVAISRAIGETMIVAIAAGAGPRNFAWPWLEDGSALNETPLNPFISAETMTGHIVRISGGDLSYQSIDYNSIFAIGMLLFLTTLTLNILSRRIVDRYREVYD